MIMNFSMHLSLWLLFLGIGLHMQDMNIRKKSTFYTFIYPKPGKLQKAAYSLLFYKKAVSTTWTSDLPFTKEQPHCYYQTKKDRKRKNTSEVQAK